MTALIVRIRKSDSSKSEKRQIYKVFISSQRGWPNSELCAIARIVKKVLATLNLMKIKSRPIEGQEILTRLRFDLQSEQHFIGLFWPCTGKIHVRFTDQS